MAEIDKWQSMLTIVNQYPELLPLNKSKTLKQQFKKIVLLRTLAENLLVFFLQYIGLKLTTFSLDPSPLWLATGTACAYLFLRGYRVLPGIWLGNFAGFYLEKIGFNLAFECATLLTVQGLLLLWLSFRYFSPTLIFYRLAALIKFIVITALLTAVISALLLGLCYSSLSNHAATIELYLKWWLANLNAILIFSCALLTWDAFFPDINKLNLFKPRMIAFGLQIALTVALIFSHTPIITLSLGFGIMLTTIWISLVFGWCGAVTASFISTMLICFAGFLNAPLFLTYTSPMSLIILQLAICITAIIGLIVALYNTKKVSILKDTLV